MIHHQQCGVMKTRMSSVPWWVSLSEKSFSEQQKGRKKLLLCIGREEKKRWYDKEHSEERSVGAGREKNEVRSRCTWNRLSCEKRKNAPVTEIATLSFGKRVAGRGGAAAAWCHTAVWGRRSRSSVMTPFTDRFTPEGAGHRRRWVTRTSSRFIATPPESKRAAQPFFFSLFPAKLWKKKRFLPFDGGSQRGLFAHILVGKGLFEMCGATAAGGAEVAAGGSLQRRSIGHKLMLLSVKQDPADVCGGLICLRDQGWQAQLAEDKHL